MSQLGVYVLYSIEIHACGYLALHIPLLQSGEALVSPRLLWTAPSSEVLDGDEVISVHTLEGG